MHKNETPFGNDWQLLAIMLQFDVRCSLVTTMVCVVFGS